MRFLNGFVLIGIILFFISIAGLVKGNTVLTEPGQPVNQYAWLEYLGAALLMLVNGAVSIWTMKKNDAQKPKPQSPADAAGVPQTSDTAAVPPSDTVPADQ